MIFLASCEDEPPTTYSQVKYLEGFLITDKPVQGILLMNSQPVNQKFDREKAMIKDADVKLSVNGTSHTLIYRDGDNPGYYHPDESFLIEPETKYEIIINTIDGSLVTAETITPKRINGWVKEPKPIISYPSDTLKLPHVDSLDIEWDKVPDVSFYLIKILAKDTSDYGRYLEPPTNELNRRTYNFMSNIEETGIFYKNPSSWNLIANNKTPTVWLAFRWFGLHEVEVYNPDPNMLNWFINIFFTASSENNELLNSVNGGLGVFGSASIVKKEVFLLKNQP